MKKLSFAVVAVLAVVAFSVAFAGCEALNEVKDEVTSYYYDVWYQYNPEKVSSLSIPIGNSDDSADDKATETIGIEELYAHYNETSGLTIVMAQKSDSSSSTKPVYGKKVYTPDEFSSAKWIALVEVGDLEKTSEPACMSHPDLYLDLSSITSEDGGIQWKKVLADLLLEKLLEE